MRGGAAGGQVAEAAAADDLEAAVGELDASDEAHDLFAGLAGVAELVADVVELADQSKWARWLMARLSSRSKAVWSGKAGSWRLTRWSSTSRTWRRKALSCSVRASMAMMWQPRGEKIADF
jgi:hypothetical protein